MIKPIAALLILLAAVPAHADEGDFNLSGITLGNLNTAVSRPVAVSPSAPDPGSVSSSARWHRIPDCAAAPQPRPVLPMDLEEARQLVNQRAYDSSPAMFTMLHNTPTALAAFGGLLREMIENGDKRDSTHGGMVADNVVDNIRNHAKNIVRAEGRAAVDCRIVQLRTLRANIPFLLPQLRAANYHHINRPGSGHTAGTSGRYDVALGNESRRPLSLLAQELLIRGDEEDTTRAQEKLTDAIRGLQTLKGDLISATVWDLPDFPRATTRAFDQMGLPISRRPLESVTDAEVLEGHELETAAHYALSAADWGMLSMEVHHIVLHGVIAVPSAAISAFGIGLAIYIHHNIEQIKEDRRALGRSLGL